MSSNNPLGTSLELDSHADTTVLGAGALIIQSYDQPVEVVGYDPQQGLQMFEMVSSILAFDHPRDGQLFDHPFFPLHLQGVRLYLPVRKPTATKWETGDIV
jgi:hypothetical protein